MVSIPSYALTQSSLPADEAAIAMIMTTVPVYYSPDYS
jgi:hypothetical protein